jgi:hypothetical protein
MLLTSGLAVFYYTPLFRNLQGKTAHETLYRAPLFAQ